MACFATGVVVVTVRDDRDDIGATVTAFTSVSLDPPMVLVGIDGDSYLAEVFDRRDRWAATVLGAGQRPLAGRFAAAGRPSARLLIADEPHHRGRLSDALVIEGGLTALECATSRRVPAGDHVLYLAEVVGIDYLAPATPPLIRVNRGYR
ncbi:MAG TPA: flavin reductase family protein [Streptosporangiaceae bacterium]|nr:flavin reductase family protein [Streptosporangiaceae bacterium]